MTTQAPTHAGGLAYMALGSPGVRALDRQRPLSRVPTWLAFVAALILGLLAAAAVSFV